MLGHSKLDLGAILINLIAIAWEVKSNIKIGKKYRKKVKYWLGKAVQLT